MLPNGYRFPDLSRYRRVSHWRSFAHAYPISACKKSEGRSWTDPYFEEWNRGMLAHGCLRMPYHFLRGDSLVQDQVNNYLDGLEGPFVPVLDAEEAKDGSSPTIAQVNEWFLQVQRRTGIPLKNMCLYMPRWWWREHGGNQRVLEDVVLWGSHFNMRPDITPYANNRVEIIQYSSSAPIVGLADPHTGDMNIAINLNIAEFLGRIKYRPAPQPQEEEDVPDILVVTCPGKPLRVVVEGSVTGFPAGTQEPLEFLAPFLAAGYKRRDVKFREADDWQRLMNALSTADDLKHVIGRLIDVESDLGMIKRKIGVAEE